MDNQVLLSRQQRDSPWHTTRAFFFAGRPTPDCEAQVVNSAEGVAGQDWREGRDPARYTLFQMAEVAVPQLLEARWGGLPEFAGAIPPRLRISCSQTAFRTGHRGRIALDAIG